MSSNINIPNRGKLEADAISHFLPGFIRSFFFARFFFQELACLKDLNDFLVLIGFWTVALAVKMFLKLLYCFPVNVGFISVRVNRNHNCCPTKQTLTTSS